MRPTILALAAASAAALLVGCSDQKDPLAPDAVSAARLRQSSAPLAAELAAGPLLPDANDRVLFDIRQSLQQATGMTSALRLFGYSASSRTGWGFTGDMDGRGTNAMRVDWRAWDGVNCVNQSVSAISRTLPTPAPKRVYFRWRQRLGRTATGGGVGTIGDFAVNNGRCPGAGRTVFSIFRADVPTTGHGRTDMVWPGPAPSRIDWRVPTLSQVFAPNKGIRYNPEDHSGGEEMEHVVYLQAESAPGARDGVVRAWVNGQLITEIPQAAVGPNAFSRFVFPGAFRAPVYAQSEYFWDLVAWEPVDDSVPPPPVDTVPPPPTYTPVLTTVTSSPANAAVVAGNTFQLTAEARDDSGKVMTAPPLAWSSTDTVVAKVSASGLVSALRAGSALIIVRDSTRANGPADTTQLTVANQVVLQAVEVTPATATLNTGGVQQFSAIGRMSDGSTQPVSVTWSATGGTVNASGSYTAGSTAGAFRVIAVVPSGLADTAAVTINAPPPPPPPSGTGASADALRLAIADRQAPRWQSYNGAALAAGQSYQDPTTGVRVWKLTSASVPVSNSGMQHMYGAGPVQISRRLSSGKHTAMFHTYGGNFYLADVQAGAGVSNYRALPGVSSAYLAATFSNHTATPHIVYYFNGTTLVRYNTLTNQQEANGFFPKSFSTQLGGSPGRWLQNDKDDRWFVFMNGSGSTVYAWDSQTNTTRSWNTGSMDEPHFDRDGRYVAVLEPGGADGVRFWDLETDAKSTLGPRVVHPGFMRGLFVSVDPWTDREYYATPSTAAATNTLQPNQHSNGIMHRGNQWIQSDADIGGDLRKQWYLYSSYADGITSLGGWTLSSGNVYSTSVGFDWDEASIGIRHVAQYAAGTTARFERSLTAATSRATMTEGTFFWDAAARQLYVWAQGGGSPSGRVAAFAASRIHDAIAYVRVDGSDLRLIAHTYSRGSRYETQPHATVSPDGLMVMWTSDMGNSSGRGDIFVAEIPGR